MRPIVPRHLRQGVLSAFLTFLTLCGLGSSAMADDAAPYCSEEDVVLDKYAYLRALSLDIRGEVPSSDEYEQLSLENDVPGAQIDEWLTTQAFGEQVARMHRSLIWNRVRGSPLLLNEVFLYYSLINTSSPALFSYFRSDLLRGGYSGCNDEPAVFDPETGEPIYEFDPATGHFKEGWVEVSPYWAPETTVKVCAGDAQANLLSADGTSCKSRMGLSRVDCGCGPNLNWCATPEGERLIRASLGNAIDVRVEEMIKNQAPYTDLYTTNISYFNGPLIHYWTHLYQRYAQLLVEPSPAPEYMFPKDIPFSAAETWVPIQVGANHAGILTSASFLIRHTSNRRRARRFIESIVCQPMILPDGGLELESEGAPDPDVTQQPGCKYCHAILEPTAQHWGRWSQFGAAYLSPETHPPCRADCQACVTEGNCSLDCRMNYVVQGQVSKELKYIGWLSSYQFVVDPQTIDEMKEIELETKVPCDPELVSQSKIASIETGPVLLVQQAIFDGRLAQCAAFNVFKWLMAREPLEEEEEWVDTLGSEFQSSDFDFATLVKLIVTDERYRRVQ